MCDILETELNTVGTARNADGEIMTVRIGRTARQHGIGNARILAALMAAGSPNAIDRDALTYVGTDPKTGKVLKLVAVPDNKNRTDLTAIHCSPLEWHSSEGSTSDD